MNFERSVFINCPIDTAYIKYLLKPILFVIIKNGFNPRLSLEVSDSGEQRLLKITKLIKSCQYSIHDISIVKSRKANEFSRMNMPFELGIDYGLRNSGNMRLFKKQFLILESTKYDYMKALSDINGMDIKVHGNETEQMFECLYTWFSETIKINKQDPPLKMFYDFVNVNSDLFEEKLNQFGNEAIAKNYIDKLSISEYIEEIKLRV